MKNTTNTSYKNKYGAHVNLFPFELHSPILGLFGERVLRDVGIYVSGLTCVRNPYTSTSMSGIA